jgi:PPOX class probable F420-dependent enzyme
VIPDRARAILEAGHLAHLVTLNPDGSPQVTCVWIGVEGDEIVCGHLGAWQKVRNVKRDPRVSMSIETDRANEIGLKEYLVVTGRAYVTEGGAAALLQRLAYVYLGPGVKFPPMDAAPEGYIMHIVPERFTGVGPWTTED